METFALPCSSILGASAMQSSPPGLTAEQSSSKRHCIDAADRLGDLPDCLLHRIISSLGSRQAVQTSVLSRRWRHLWRNVPCVAIDEREFAGEPWERFEDFADRVLTTIPSETRLDAFRLHLVSFDSMESYATSDRWIRRGLRHFPAAVEIRAVRGTKVRWQPHPYDYSAVVRQQPDLSVMGSCAAGFTRRLTTLRLVGVKMTACFVEDLGRHCPALEELHIEWCSIPKLRAVTSPTLRSLVVVQADGSVCCAHLTITAPRLACLRFEIFYDGGVCNCVAEEAAPEPELLVSLADASIRLTVRRQWRLGNREWRKRQLEFLKSMRRFLGLLPNVTKLHLAGFTPTALLEEESQEFPVFHNLKNLLLEECDVGLKFPALTGVLRNTHNLENLALHHCKFLARPAKKSRERGRQQPSKVRRSTPPVFWCKNLKSIDIKRREEDAPELLEVLSVISQGMQSAQWRRVNTSTTVVQSLLEIEILLSSKFE